MRAKHFLTGRLQGFKVKSGEDGPELSLSFVFLLHEQTDGQVDLLGLSELFGKQATVEIHPLQPGLPMKDRGEA